MMCRVRTIIKIATPVLSLLLGSQANAMQALGDKDLSDITGQAFITVDTSSYTDSTYGNYEFARINLGVDIEIQANADSVKIGTFEREYGSEDPPDRRNLCQQRRPKRFLSAQ